jgi:hypothetical protein
MRGYCLSFFSLLHGSIAIKTYKGKTMNASSIKEQLLNRTLNRFQNIKLSMLKNIDRTKYSEIINSIVIAKDPYKGQQYIKNIRDIRRTILLLPY